MRAGNRSLCFGSETLIVFEEEDVNSELEDRFNYGYFQLILKGNLRSTYLIALEDS
jgi:hypothetical protein